MNDLEKITILRPDSGRLRAQGIVMHPADVDRLVEDALAADGPMGEDLEIVRAAGDRLCRTVVIVPRADGDRLCDDAFARRVL